MTVADDWSSRLIRQVARTIEIEISPDEFVYRYKDQERRVATRGYVLRLKGEEPCYQFDEKRETAAHVPIDLSASVPLEFRPDVGKVLAAFLWYGMRPLCRKLVRPILVFKGIERFETGFGFEYAAFREAGAEIATRVHFKA